MKVIQKLWNHSPKENFSYLKKRLMRKSYFDSDINKILSDIKTFKINPSIIIDRWERYSRVMNIGFNPSQMNNNLFSSKNIYELGCGPLMGIAPIAIFFDCKNFFYSDPDFTESIFFSEDIKEYYLKNFYNELTLNYGAKIEFDEFYERMRNRCVNYLSNSRNTNKFDFVFSNSALEHVKKNEIDPLLGKIFKNCSDESKYFHSVDFTSHKVDMLDEIYFSERTKNNKLLNKLRKSEIEKIFNEKGFISNKTVVYKKMKVNVSKIHRSWADYSTNDLESSVVFFFGSLHKLEEK